MNKKEYKRILIIEVNWVGDVLFSTPFIRAIRENFKDSYVACMVVPRCQEILEYNPYINELIIYDEKGIHKSLIGKWRLIRSIRKKKFDIAIILHRSFTRALIAFLAGIKNRAGFITKKRRFIINHPLEVPDEPLHKVEYFLKIAESLGCDISRKDYEFFISDKERKYIKDELSTNGINDNDLLVVLNPGGNWTPKRWNVENFAMLSDRLINEYNAKVVISGAGKDKAIAGAIERRSKKKPVIICGKTNLKELAALMERANVVISGDSGPMHIAVAMKSNVIALFGPTSPNLTGPYGTGNYEIIQKNTNCDVPCYDISCDDYRCMDAITVNDVLKVFDRIYSTQIGADKKHR